MLLFFAICCVQSVEGMADGCFTSMSHSFATPEPTIMKGKLHGDISCHSYGTLLNKLALPSVLSPNDSGSIDPQKDDILGAKRHASCALCNKSDANL